MSTLVAHEPGRAPARQGVMEVAAPINAAALIGAVTPVVI